jgi:dTDP-4-amino-4,6-dideoxygalactose transaminase
VMEQLSNVGIECRLLPQPASSFAIYDALPQGRVARGRNRVSYALSHMVLSLPSGTNLSDAEIDKVCRAVAHVTAQKVSCSPTYRKAA